MARTVWQLGAGNGRNLVEYYKLMGVACIGPGVPVKDLKYNEIDCDTKNEATSLWAFVNEVKPNDIIYVKDSLWSISLVGIVKEKAGDKIYHLLHGQEGMVDGWDLQHQIQVDWYEVIDSDAACKYLVEKNYRFPINRFSRCGGIAKNLKEDDSLIIGILSNQQIFKKAEPNPGSIRKFHYDLPQSFQLDIEETRLINARIAECKNEEFRKIFLVIPFLRKLGWFPELMEFEKNTREGMPDIILYTDLSHSNVFAVVETKMAGKALASWALKQAEKYAESMIQKQMPRLVIITEGVRYVCKCLETKDEFEFDRQSNKSTIQDVQQYLHPSTYPELDNLK